MTFEPIGFVRCEVTEQTDCNWGEITSQIIVQKDLAEGLKGLKQFSHAIIVYHSDKARFERERHLVRRPQGREDMPMVGIFSQRAKDRPNPIGVTAVRVIDVNDTVLTVAGLDAINDTPVLDIKPYYPAFDLKTDVKVPGWVDELMKDYF